MANFNYNHAAIGGRLVNAPELKQTQGGQSVTTFTVAVNRKVNTGDNQIADFLNCIAWGKTAEFISKYFKKGSSIMVTGEVRNHDYEKDGEKRRTLEILVREAAFVDSKRNEAEEAAQNANNATGDTTGQPRFEDIKEDDDLPF